MRMARISLAAICALCCGLLHAQEKNDALPTSKRRRPIRTASDICTTARKSSIRQFQKGRQAGCGHCVACQKQVVKFGTELEDWKAAEFAAQEMIAEAQGGRATALAHYDLATVFMTEGMLRKKDEYLTRAHEEIGQAISAYANFPDAVFIDGELLARLQQDDAAKARFEQFVKITAATDPKHVRACAT